MGDLRLDVWVRMSSCQGPPSAAGGRVHPEGVAKNSSGWVVSAFSPQKGSANPWSEAIQLNRARSGGESASNRANRSAHRYEGRVAWSRRRA